MKKKPKPQPPVKKKRKLRSIKRSKKHGKRGPGKPFDATNVLLARVAHFLNIARQRKEIPSAVAIGVTPRGQLNIRVELRKFPATTALVKADLLSAINRAVPKVTREPTKDERVIIDAYCRLRDRFEGQPPIVEEIYEEVYEETPGAALNPDSYRKKIRRTLKRHHLPCVRSTIRGHR